MTVRGQHLLQANEPTSDDDDENIVEGETWCSESEAMLTERDSLSVSQNESDDSDCELALSYHWQRKGTALEEDRVLQVLRSINRRVTSLYSCYHPGLASSPIL